MSKFLELLTSRRFWIIVIAAVVKVLAQYSIIFTPEVADIIVTALGSFVVVGTVDKLFSK